MTRLLLALGVVVLFLAREIARNEYKAWSGALARALVRLAGRIRRASFEEWWAEVVEVQQVRGESGLGYATTVVLSSLRMDRGEADVPLAASLPWIGLEEVGNPTYILGQRVRMQRVRLGLSQEDLGRLAGFHRTYVGSVERGERNPSMLNVLRLAAALQLDPGDLLREMPIDWSGP